MTLGDNIKKIRKERKLTQQQLAKEMDISRSYLSDVENNRYNPSMKTVEKLAEKLNVTSFYLITGKKSFGDLDENEWKDAFEKKDYFMHEVREKNEIRVKEELHRILNRKLSSVETIYFLKILEFLKLGDSEDLVSLSHFLGSLNTIIKHKIEKSIENGKITESDLENFINSELEEIAAVVADIYHKEYQMKDGD